MQSAPGATYYINYRTPAGINSATQGLYIKQSDGNGNVSWTWVIGIKTQPGTGSLTVPGKYEAIRSDIITG